MSKPKTEYREVRKGSGEGEARAVLNRLRVSPIKLNYVAKLIRGMKVEAAITQLTFSNKRIAQDVKKAVQSAVANAENNFSLNVDELVVAEAWVGKSIVMKRMHTRARGRGARIIKPFSNLTIILREKGE
ncbi:MAG: 50S ribosomal protein L22 [Pseudomonadota bacterium]